MVDFFEFGQLIKLNGGKVNYHFLKEKYDEGIWQDYVYYKRKGLLNDIRENKQDYIVLTKEGKIFYDKKWKIKISIWKQNQKRKILDLGQWIVKNKIYVVALIALIVTIIPFLFKK